MEDHPNQQGVLNVNTRLFSASNSARICYVLVLVAIAAYPVVAWAQTAGTPVQNRIAVIDIKYILENHLRFKGDMERLKTRFEAAGKQLQTERTRIIDMEKQLVELNPGTTDYNQLEEQITRLKAEWTVQANKQKKDIRNSESQILWNVYYEIKTETKRYCEQNGIGLVIQFNGDPIKNNQPQDVVRGISRPIVYNARSFDITPVILRALNAGGARPAGPIAGRQGVPTS
jgi:Skp family chaperone for outer membrane proteins